jgi:hypothetical protein
MPQATKMQAANTPTFMVQQLIQKRIAIEDAEMKKL